MKISGVSRAKIEEAIRGFVDLGTVREAKGITHEEMEAIYGVGLAFYRAGNYADAEKVFKFICLFDHVNSRYWTALGGVRQAKRDFAMAAEAYKFAIFLDVTNLKPTYYLAECFAVLGETDHALGMLDELERLAKKSKDPKAAALLAKGNALKAKLEQKKEA